MNKRSRPGLRSALPAVCLALGPLLGPAAARAAETNVLLVTIDTLRPDRLGCYGSKLVQTPRIDALAARGVLFERAFAHDPTTLPSHANILLGTTALVHGVNENGLSVIPKEATTLAAHLKGKGYAAGAFVSAFALDSRFGLNTGFDVYDDRYPAKPAPGFDYAERKADKTIEAALAWLSLQKGRWFCWIHLWDPHFPYVPPEPYAGRFAADPYSGEVAFVDACLGKLFEDGDKKGWSARTLVVLTADHGESLGEHGEATHSYFAYDSTISVPLIIAGPGIKPARVGDFVGHVDIFPTVCDVLGLARPAVLEGESLGPLLRARTRKARPIYIEAVEANLNNGWAPLRGIIEGGKKFIDLPIPELYDLARDFDEQTNLAGKTDLAPYRKSLRGMMDKAAAAAPKARGGERAVGRETRERLQSLGYVISPVSRAKKSYGPEDDLKTLLPLRTKLERAALLDHEGKTAESVPLFEEIIAARQDFGAAYDALFQSYLSVGRTEAGLQVLEKGFRANPDSYGFITRYGLALVRTGRFKAGAEILEQALGLFTRDAEIWNSLGLAYWRLGDMDKALKDFREALSLDPGDAIYNENIGALYVVMAMKAKNQANLELAVSYFQTSIGRDPTIASAHNGLAGAYELLGKKDEAIASWEKAVGLDPNYDFAVYNLAFACLAKGDKDRALKYGRKYLDLRGAGLSAQERQEIEALIERCKK